MAQVLPYQAVLGRLTALVWTTIAVRVGEPPPADVDPDAC
jgi:hypothetical protein